jgi:bacterioferritin
MGEMAQKISKVDYEELIKTLNVAFAEEWLAYYQYWIGSLLAVGPERTSIAKEFMEHAKEELEHANLLAARIIELGGTPILSPQDWAKTAICRYEEPSNPLTIELLKQNLISERCAIARYEKICEITFGKDYETHRMSAKILHDELEHEEEITSFQNDIKQNRDYDDFDD